MVDDEFLTQIRGYLPSIEKLRNYPSHRIISRKNSSSKFDHSIRVSILSYRIAKKIGADARICARAGLLHDWGYLALDIESDVFRHPSIGAEMAERIGQKEVAEIISSHMFPVGKPPRSAEALIVWFTDKLDSLLELFHLTNFIDTCKMIIEKS